MSRLLAFAVLALVTGTPAAAQTAARADTVITLTDDTGASKRLTLGALRALPQVEYRVSETDGAPMVLKGPTLRSVLSLMDAPAGQNLRGLSMRLVVIAEAADGYRVAYSLAELDDQFGARRAIIALTQDGKALAERDGPFRIIMADETHRARWVRNLTGLRLVRVGS